MINGTKQVTYILVCSYRHMIFDEYSKTTVEEIHHLTQIVPGKLNILQQKNGFRSIFTSSAQTSTQVLKIVKKWQYVIR